MTALLLALLLAQPVDSVGPVMASDAPTVERIEAGQVAPFSGVLLTETQAILQAKRIRSAETERDELRQSAPSWVVVSIAVGVGLVVGATTVGIVVAAARR